MNVEKFKAYWESIGEPELQLLSHNVEWIDLPRYPFFNSNRGLYRIKGDPNWELRAKWIDSDFTLPIEYLDKWIDDWMVTKYPRWINTNQYREEVTRLDMKFPPVNLYSAPAYNRGFDAGWNAALEAVKIQIEGVKK